MNSEWNAVCPKSCEVLRKIAKCADPMKRRVRASPTIFHSDIGPTILPGTWSHQWESGKIEKIGK